ncbi:MAG: hypothetical protein ACJ736_38705 [Streptomyces sp.]
MGRSVVVGAVLFPAPFALAAIAGGPSWAAAGLLGAAYFLVGLGVMWFDVNLNSLQTAVTPDALRSRVVGAYSTVNYGIRPLGALAGGALATAFGLRATLVTVAVGGVLSVLWLLPSPIPGIRLLETGPWHGAAERPSPTRESGPPGRPVGEKGERNGLAPTQQHGGTCGRTSSPRSSAPSPREAARDCRCR